MSSLPKRLEVLTNVVVLIAAVIIGAAVIKKTFYPNQPPAIIKKGDVIGKAVGPLASNKNLILALSTTCHFCNDSAPFYRRLTDQAKSTSTHLLAIFPQAVEESRSYLQNKEIGIADIRKNEFSSLKLEGTPTLLLVDQNGKVINTWIGRLSEQEENNVLREIRD